MNEARLAAFETMLNNILKEYDTSVELLARLKVDGKEKTATFKQMFSNKLQYQQIIDIYKYYGLLQRNETKA